MIQAKTHQPEWFTPLIFQLMLLSRGNQADVFLSDGDLTIFDTQLPTPSKDVQNLGKWVCPPRHKKVCTMSAFQYGNTMWGHLDFYWNFYFHYLIGTKIAQIATFSNLLQCPSVFEFRP